MSPGRHGVPAVGAGTVPGVHRQPGRQNCPASQISPGLHIADFGGLGLFGGVEDGEPGDVGPGGIAMHPDNSTRRRGHARMRWIKHPGT